jgi:hypothetical protein
MLENTIDKTRPSMVNVSDVTLDKTSASVIDGNRITLQVPDLETLKKARRWLAGAARLLGDASNGCPMVERIACEAATVALMAEVAVLEYSE